jgi:hypothetical protein
MVLGAVCEIMRSNEDTSGTKHWQLVKITGVGLGEMWFDQVADELTQREAEQRAANRDRYVAVPMPYDPDGAVPIGHVVDDYERQVVENV